ncbi:MAG: DUF4258 domain-containing protein [Candidatus Aenigmarchaeota archaeon]|nr:DUF4258 domain-containing protein [Candidatus Aenigmarchaeota archaeon]
MIEFSDHAKTAMRKHGITEDEIMKAMIDGVTEFELLVDGEKRYGNVLAEKARRLIVVWCHKGANKRVITCYPLKRKG